MYYIDHHGGFAEYQGGFEASCFSGKGQLRLSNGDIYQGNFANSLYSGHGTLTFGGHSYEGEFENGDFHGIGSLTLSNDMTITGFFK